jgi:hypothetical protein
MPRHPVPAETAYHEHRLLVGRLLERMQFLRLGG